MKAGDKIRYKKITRGVRLGGAEPKRIEYLGDEWVIYRTWSSKGSDLGEYAVTREEFERDFELVPDFFEEGKTYTRHVSWSILAQRHNVTERFTVQSVGVNDIRTAAFGLHSVDGDSRANCWNMLVPHDWRTGQWKEEL